MMNEYQPDALTANNLDTFVMRSAILKSLQASLDKFSGRFLDIGAGNQPYRELIETQSQVTEYTALDLADNKQYKDSEHTWDGTTIPFTESSFDCAMATEVLEHCPDPEVTLKETCRVLKPGGILFFTVPFVWPLHDAPHDEYRYTPWSLERHLSNSGFDNIQVWPTAGWDATLAQCLGLWVRRRSMSKRKRKVLSFLIRPFMRSLINRDCPVKSFAHRQYLMPGIAGTSQAKK